jgi:diacylglycerol O-acyltransferase
MHAVRLTYHPDCGQHITHYERWLGVLRFRLPEELAALDELLLKGDGRPATGTAMTLTLLLADTPSAGHFEASFRKAAAAVPRMRQRLARSAFGGGRTWWVDDDELDLSYHLHRVGAPGDGSLEAALAWASAGCTARFDAARPLWEAVLVERLVDGRALVLIRAHHAIADGVRAIQMMTALLDLEAAPPPTPAPDDHVVPADRVLSPVVAEMVRAITRVWVTTPRQSAAIALTAWGAGAHPFRTVTRARSYVLSTLRTADRGGAISSPLLADRGSARAFATIEMRLDLVEAAAKAQGVTVNDVYLTGLLGGFRRYHEAFGVAATDLAVALPIDISGSVEHEAGNHISGAVIPGPASIADPVARLRAVHRLVASRRAEPGLGALDRLAPALRRVPARLTVAAVGAHADRVDLQASNLVGPPFPVYLAGVKVEQMYAFGPLPGVPAMAVLVSYRGMCTIGFTLDPAAVTDVSLFVDCVRDAMDELLTDCAPEVQAAL